MNDTDVENILSESGSIEVTVMTSMLPRELASVDWNSAEAVYPQ